MASVSRPSSRWWTLPESPFWRLLDDGRRTSASKLWLARLAQPSRGSRTGGYEVSGRFAVTSEATKLPSRPCRLTCQLLARNRAKRPRRIGLVLVFEASCETTYRWVIGTYRWLSSFRRWLEVPRGGFSPDDTTAAVASKNGICSETTLDSSSFLARRLRVCR